MSIVNFELEDLARYGISREDLKGIVEKLGMSLEEISEKSAVIDITPNRPDMLGIVGFARAANLLTGKKIPKEKFYTINNNPLLQVSVTTAVKKVRPFIAVSVIKGVDLSGNRLKDLINFTEKFCDTYGRKRKKIAIGLHNFDVISGPLTYDASTDGEFIPLGSKSKRSFSDIIKEHEKGIKYSSTLRKSKKYPFLKDSNGVLSLIPIINSEHTRVTNSTKNLLIDITGTSQESVEEALALMACSFLDLDAQVYPCEVLYPKKTSITPKLEYKNIRIKRSKAEKTLGVYMEENRIVGLANRLGHVAAKYGSYILLYVPPYRLDVFNEQDVIEDIAIAYGYDKIEPIPIVGVSYALPDPSKEKANNTSRLMLGMGFSEAMNPYLTNEHLNFESVGHKNREESTIRVEYAKTTTITMLRTDILPYLIQNLGKSTNERMPQRLFEIGSVFCVEKNNVVESTNIAIVSEHSRANYSEMKSVVSSLLKSLGCNDYSIKETSDGALIEGRAAKIIAGNDELGYFGEVSPKVLDNFKIEEPVIAAEIKLDKCLSHVLKDSNHST